MSFITGISDRRQRGSFTTLAQVCMNLREKNDERHFLKEKKTIANKNTRISDIRHTLLECSGIMRLFHTYLCSHCRRTVHLHFY